ncbi:hypothetical protein [Pseudotenacibaculum haliotis]|uniref:Glycosyltransferase RgtA/B/C/D-like domain-containing protein n=1 Tax=Pseudotenacibaculum haliotis TaxID=1862138 RepID=A0ABW5LPU4_9FLAO
MKFPNLTYQKIILIVLIFISFGASIWNEYSLDDEYVTTLANQKVSKGFDGLKEIFISPYVDENVDSRSFEYRPFTQAVFAVEKGFFGFNAGLGHLINLLIYIWIVLLGLKILRTLLSEDYYPYIFFALALFSLHPLHSEVVLSLKNREELLVTLFGLYALLYAIKYSRTEKRKTAIISIVFLVLGTLTKATIAPFVLVIPLTLWLFKLSSAKKSLLFFLASFAIMTFVRFLSFIAFNISINREISFVESPLLHKPFWDRLPMAFYSFYEYLSLHLIPHPLLSYYGYNQVPILSWSDSKVYLGLLFAVAAVFLFFYFLKRNRLFSYGILLTVIFLLPFLNFPFPATGILAERYTFNSVLGFSILIIVLLKKLSELVKVQQLTLVITSIILVGYSFLNIKRTPHWKSKLSLIENDAKYGTQSYKLQALLGDIYQEQIGKSSNVKDKKLFFEKTLRAYEKAAKIYDKDPGLYNNIGTTFFAGAQYENAIILFKKAIELGADSETHYYNLGLAYELSGKREEAKQQYNIILKKNPNYQDVKQRLKALN